MKRIIILIFLLIQSVSCTTNSPILDNAFEDASFAGTKVSLEVRQRGIWLVGGSDSLGPLSAVDLYDPYTDTWYPNITQLPTPRTFAGIASAGGQIFVVGGITSNGETTAITEVFDIASHRWSRGIDFPVGIQGLNLVSINGKIYAVGGSMTSDAEGAFSKIMKMNSAASFWVSLYDIAGNNTYFRTDGGAAVLDGVLHFMGGRDQNGTWYNTHYGHYVMDYIGTFTATAIPQQRVALSVSSYSSSEKKYLLITGGIYTNTIVSQPHTGAAQNTFYYYTPIMNTQAMVSGAVMNSARAYHGSVVWRSNIYIFGGYDNGTILNSFEHIDDIESYNPLSSASWSVGTSNLPRERYGFQAVTIDGQ